MKVSCSPRAPQPRAPSVEKAGEIDVESKVQPPAAEKGENSVYISMDVEAEKVKYSGHIRGKIWRQGD